LNRSGPPFPILFLKKYFLASTDRRPSHREMTTPGYLFDLFFLSFIITISHTPNQTISSWEKLLNQKPRQIICSFHLIHRPPLRESGNNRKAFSHVLYLSLSFVVVVVVVVVIKVELFIKGLKVLIRGDFSLNSMEKELELNFFWTTHLNNERQSRRTAWMSHDTTATTTTRPIFCEWKAPKKNI
jgi:hypothetical protein